MIDEVIEKLTEGVLVTVAEIEDVIEELRVDVTDPVTDRLVEMETVGDGLLVMEEVTVIEGVIDRVGVGLREAILTHRVGSIL